MAKFEDQLRQDAKKVERLSIPSSHAAEMVDIEDEIDNNEGFDMDELVLEEDDMNLLKLWESINSTQQLCVTSMKKIHTQILLLTSYHLL